MRIPAIWPFTTYCCGPSTMVLRLTHCCIVLRIREACADVRVKLVVDELGAAGPVDCRWRREATGCWVAHDGAGNGGEDEMELCRRGKCASAREGACGGDLGSWEAIGFLSWASWASGPIIITPVDIADGQFNPK